MLIDVPSSFKRPDGIWEHHIRQSDLGTFQQCPELHRRQMVGQQVSLEGDVALVGTACHAAYADITNGLMQGNEWTLEECVSAGVDYLHHEWIKAELAGTLRQMQIAAEKEALDMVAACVKYWYSSMYDWLKMNQSSIESVEYRFDLLVYEDLMRKIYLTGTWDLGMKFGLFDYKHSTSQKYTKQKAWQLSRYHPQPTHYSWAHDIVAYDNNTLDYPSATLLDPFSFININPEKGIEIIGEGQGLQTRTVGDCLFHLEVMRSLAYLIEAELPSWPLAPTDWWCSAKWCPAWKECRGKHIGDDPWGLLEKVEVELGKRR